MRKISTLLLAVSAFTAERRIEEVRVTPDEIPGGQTAQVTVTAAIRGFDAIPNGVSVQRLDGSGRVVATAGTMHDDGDSGDVAAGDGIFTLRASFHEMSAGEIRLRVSAAARGEAQRVLSAVAVVRVTQ